MYKSQDTISTIAGRYEELAVIRRPYYDRARDAADVTVPVLFPDENQGNTQFHRPWQSVGAAGVKNLASKLLLSLLPPNTPFFRFKLDEYLFEELSNGDPDFKAGIEEGLSKAEKAVASEVETSGVRVAVFNALRQLLIAGNVLLYIPPEESIKVIRLDRYVVDRDPMGNVLEIITKECVSKRTLPDDIKANLHADLEDRDIVDVFTRVNLRDDGDWDVAQEIGGYLLPSSKGIYKADKMPYLALRLTKLDGEDYGPGFVEEVLGDLLSLERLSQALNDSAAAAARIIYFVSPTSGISVEQLVSTPNGGFISGNQQDVTTLQFNKQGDLNVVQQSAHALETRLSKAFLLNSSVQRPGERVTAQEIRYVAQELEDALGGVYSVLSQEFQLPLVNLLIQRMEAEDRFPELPKDVVKPQVVTGLDALGREHELDALGQAMAALGQFVPQEMLAQFIRPTNLISRVLTSKGIDPDGLIKTDEEIAAEKQQAQQAAMMQQALPNVITQGGQIIKDQANIQAQQ